MWKNEKIYTLNKVKIFLDRRHTSFSLLCLQPPRASLRPLSATTERNLVLSCIKIIWPLISDVLKYYLTYPQHSLPPFSSYWGRKNHTRWPIYPMVTLHLPTPSSVESVPPLVLKLKPVNSSCTDSPLQFVRWTISSNTSILKKFLKVLYLSLTKKEIHRDTSEQIIKGKLEETIPKSWTFFLSLSQPY